MVYRLTMYRDVPFNSIVVQKYGGTSVGSVERIQRTAERIALRRQSGWERLAIVVSAMAGETNRLVELVHQVNPDSSDRSYDVAVSAGEQVSVGLVCAALEAHGIEAVPLLGFQLGMVTDNQHGRARIQSIATDKIEAAWMRSQIPVVAGFQGMTADLAVTTLGRGGSDTSAVALAVGLKAAFCEINTDVDGLYTADPRIVPKAQLIKEIDYESALEMASLGGKVLHTRCVELAAKYQMPLTVRNSFIDPDSVRRTRMSLSVKALEAPVVSGVSLDRSVAKVTLRNWKKSEGELLKVFSPVAEHGANVDIIVFDRREGALTVGFTVSESDLPLALSGVEAFQKETGERELTVETKTGLAKVSAIGLGMRSHGGVATRMFEALQRHGIEILMISTSEIKISCVVPDRDGERATQVVHDLYF